MPERNEANPFGEGEPADEQTVLAGMG